MVYKENILDRMKVSYDHHENPKLRIAHYWGILLTFVYFNNFFFLGSLIPYADNYFYILLGIMAILNVGQLYHYYHAFHINSEYIIPFMVSTQMWMLLVAALVCVVGFHGMLQEKEDVMYHLIIKATPKLNIIILFAS